MQAKSIGLFKMKTRLQICQLSEFFRNLKGHKLFNYQHNKLKISNTKTNTKIQAPASIKTFKIFKSLMIIIFNNF